jgi:hypothetical protein
MYGGSAPTAVASAAPVSAPAVDSATYLSTFPDVRASAAANVATASDAGNNTGSNNPMFRSLFQADEHAQPVSPAVRELWGNSSALTTAANADGQTSGIGAPRPLDLFSDRNGTFSG